MCEQYLSEDKWFECKRACYKKNKTVFVKGGAIMFDRDELTKTHGIGDMSYDDFIELQKKSLSTLNHSLESIYLDNNDNVLYSGKIADIVNDKVFFDRIYIRVTDSAGNAFEEYANLISVPFDDFKMYKKGDYVKFSADVCRYLENSPEPLLNFTLCNICNISKIEELELYPNDSSLKDAIERFVCNELCPFKRECDMSLYNPNYYMSECMAGEAWRESTQNSLYDVAARIKIQKNYGGYPVLYFSQKEVY